MMWTDDPVRDAERYMARLEEFERQCLHCVVCGSAIGQDEDYYEVDNCEYCPECMKEEFRKVADYRE